MLVIRKSACGAQRVAVGRLLLSVGIGDAGRRGDLAVSATLPVADELTVACTMYVIVLPEGIVTVVDIAAAAGREAGGAAVAVA